MTSSSSGLSIDAEKSGLAVPLVEQMNLLTGLLTNAVAEHAGADVLDLVESLHALCVRADETEDPALLDDAARKIADQPIEMLVWLLRTFTSFFHLINQSEKQEIIRINRKRSIESTLLAPRRESIDEAVSVLKKQGMTLDELTALMNRMDIWAHLDRSSN